MKKIVPAGHRLLVLPDEVQTKTSSGLHLPVDEKRQKLLGQYGEIIAIGPDCWLAFRKIDGNGKEVMGQPWAEVGDRVMFKQHAGKHVLDPNDMEADSKYVLMDDNDIIAVIKDCEETDNNDR